MDTRERVLWAGAVLGAASLVAGVSNAGSLTPSGSPAPSMRTLDDLAALTAAGVGAHAISTVPAGFGGPMVAELILNGERITGEDMVLNLSEMVQSFGFAEGVVVPLDISGQPSGQRRYEPIVFRKRIDNATPLIAKALTSNESAEATFKFFRPNPSGDGTTEHFFTIEISEGRVVGQRLLTGTASQPNTPAMEEVSLVFEEIRWTFEPTGVTHTDSLIGPV